jgi:anti-sigma factor RsiW
MNRNCDVPTERLEAYIDGELHGGERRRMESHVARCDACRATMEREARLRRDFAALPELPCPDAVTRRILVATISGGEALADRSDAGAGAAPAGGRGFAARAGRTDRRDAPRPDRPARASRRRFRTAPRWLAGAAAAAVLAVLLGVGLTDRGGGPATETAEATRPATDAGSDTETITGASTRPSRVVIGGGTPDSPAAAAEEARAGFAVAARIIARAEEEALAGAFGERVTGVLRESLAIVLDRPTGGRG